MSSTNYESHRSYTSPGGGRTSEYHHEYRYGQLYNKENISNIKDAFFKVLLQRRSGRRRRRRRLQLGAPGPTHVAFFQRWFRALPPRAPVARPLLLLRLRTAIGQHGLVGAEAHKLLVQDGRKRTGARMKCIFVSAFAAETTHFSLH